MRRLIPFLSSFYPRAWRERYGQEFEALLEDVSPTPRAALNIFTGALSMQIKTWNFGWILAISAGFSCAAFAALYFSTPTKYVSAGTLKLVGSGPRLGKETLDRVYALTQQVESRASLIDILTSQKLYLKERSDKPLEDVLDQMRRDIRVEAIGADSSVGFKVSMSYPDPQAAQHVVQALIADYLKEYVRTAQGGEVSSPIQVASPASLPSRPSYPSVLSLATVAAFAGAIVLSILLFFRRFEVRRRA